jgi:hypothetical protein
MSLSAINPPEALLPPWNWNPAQTFIDAYNTQRITDQKTEEMRMSNELEKILFPLKVQNAQLQLEKLIQDRDRTMLLNEQLRESRRNASTGINAAISGVGGADGQTPSRRAAIDWSAWGNPSAQQTSDDLIP